MLFTKDYGNFKISALHKLYSFITYVCGSAYLILQKNYVIQLRSKSYILQAVEWWQIKSKTCDKSEKNTEQGELDI